MVEATSGRGRRPKTSGAQNQVFESYASASAGTNLSSDSFAFVINTQYGQTGTINRFKKGFDKFMDSIAVGRRELIRKSPDLPRQRREHPPI